ncbi:MAG: C25 family cysteine peptidase [Pseudomonadota bacterium]
MVATLSVSLLALALAPAAIGAGSPAEVQHVSTCQGFFGDVRRGAPGLHWGPVVHMGDRALRSVWDPRWGGPGSRPLLVRGEQGPGIDEREPLLLDDAPPPRKELIILTTNSLAADSRVLPRFMDLRQAEGWEVVLATEADWNVSTGGALDDRPERIRTWLKGRYEDDPGAFLLLIGDPDPDVGDVPMKAMHPFHPIWSSLDADLQEEFEIVPTDWYYADLQEDWDCDGDGYFGEYDDDRRCVDWGPELFVGRLPIYGDVSQLDAMLQRLIDHDLEADKSYRLDLLLAAAFLGFDEGGDGGYSDHDDAACVMDALYEALPLEFLPGTTRLYEGEGIITSLYSCEGLLNRDRLIEEWKQGRGFIFLSGHGWPQEIYRVTWDGDDDGNGYASGWEEGWTPFIQSGDEMELFGTPAGFTFHMSCQTGKPEDRENLGFSFLKGGAVATMAATRSCWGTTVGYGEVWEPWPEVISATTLGYYYVLNLTAGWTLGESAAWPKYALPGDGWGYWNAIAWTTRFEFNVYGDPTRTMEQCVEDEDCDDGSPCDGTETCEVGFCIHHDPVDCSSLDTDCAVGRCEISSGECYSAPRAEGASCDDGSWCTELDACSEGVCLGQDRDCGDRPGHTWSCDEDADQCVWEALPEDEGGCGGCASRATGGAALGGLALLGLPALIRRQRRR